MSDKDLPGDRMCVESGIIREEDGGGEQFVEADDVVCAFNIVAYLHHVHSTGWETSIVQTGFGKYLL